MSAKFELSQQQAAAWDDGQRLTGTAGRVQLVGKVPSGAESGVQAALGALVARHEILRTTFERPPGLRRPIQVVNDDLPFAWQVSDDDDVDRIAVAEMAATLDLASGPVLRGHLVRSGPDTHIVLTASALIADRRSLQLATACAAGVAADRDDPIQYAEYAAWQAGVDEDEEEASLARQWWGTNVAAGPEPTALGLLTPQKPVVVPPVALSPTTVQAVADLVDAAGTTPAQAWLTVWVAALSWLTNADDVLLDVEVDGRHGEELAGAVGPYTRLLRVAFHVDRGQSLRGLVPSVSSTIGWATRCQEWDPGAAVPGRLPVSFGGPMATPPAAGGAVVTLSCSDDPDGPVALVVDGVAVSAEDASRLARLVDAFVIAALGTPGRLDDIDAYGIDEAYDGDERGRPGPSNGDLSPSGLLIERILAHGRRQPDHDAVVDGDVTLSYGVLADRVERLAASIHTASGPDRTVGLLLDRSADAVVAILAVMRAGCAYLPLAPDQPDRRLRYQLADSGAALVVTSAANRGALGDFAGRVVLVEDDHDGSAPPVRADHPEDLAYVMYTSGSTGEPKGVAVTQGALANYVDFVLELLAADGVGHWGHVTGLSTDLGNTCLFPSLVSGGTLHLVPGEAVTDPALFARYTRLHPLDVMKITPSHLEALLVDGDPDVLPRRVLVIGGETCPWDLVDKVERLSTCRIINHYGPTETTVGSLVHDLTAGDARYRSRPAVPIGRPIANTAVVVMSDRLRAVPRGAPGELCIGGAGVAAGYIGDAEGTAVRFVADPHHDGRRLYRTGDVVRRFADGTVEFLGRRDGQIKVRGFRIERGEVESALRSHPGVQRAAVVARGERSATRLVGYFVAHFHPSPTTAELREHLLARLPPHMVPSTLVELDALPLLANGKLDQGALPDPDTIELAGRAYDAPRTEVEVQVGAILSELLGVDRIGLGDNFFELGGNSLLATQVVVRIREAVGVQLAVHALFVAATVGDLAAAVEADLAGDAAIDDAELTRMLEELAALSDDEAAALLAEEPAEDDLR